MTSAKHKMGVARKRKVTGSGHTTHNNKRPRHDTKNNDSALSKSVLPSGTATAIALRCCRVPATTVRGLIWPHNEHRDLNPDSGYYFRRPRRHMWRTNALVCCGRRWMFECECEYSEMEKRHLLVSFDGDGSCRARWLARYPGARAICWVDAIWAMSQLNSDCTTDVPSACLGFLKGENSPSPPGTPTPRFADRIDRALNDGTPDYLYVVCGLRWTGHALTGYVRHKQRSAWVSVGVVPG